MDILTKIVLVALLALVVTTILSLIRIGAYVILEYAEMKWGGLGGVVAIVLWVFAFPIMLLLSLVFGIRRFIEAKKFQFLPKS